EDGIRDRNVTGVQTCALPILMNPAPVPIAARAIPIGLSLKRFCPGRSDFLADFVPHLACQLLIFFEELVVTTSRFSHVLPPCSRSEERRVGKGCRCWWSRSVW